MLLKRGNTVESLLKASSISRVEDNLAEKVYEYVNETLKEEKRGHLKLIKSFQRMEHHLEQFNAAHNDVMESYTNFVTPATRVSSKHKAQFDMLSSMPDKMLRQYAHAMMVAKADDFILPDEKEGLIDAIIDKLSEGS